MGGLGLLYPSHQAAPDFVINMKSSMKCATDGIWLNKDLDPLQFCPYIGALYSQEHNPNSTYLHQFYALLHFIAQVGCAPTTPQAEKSAHFLTRTSTSSARSYIKSMWQADHRQALC